MVTLVAISITASGDAGAFQKYLDEAHEENVWVTHTGYYPQIAKDGKGITASVNGLRVHGDRLRVMFAANDCNVAQLHTTFTTHGNNSQFLEIKNRPVKATISLTETSRQSQNTGAIKNCDPDEDTKCSNTLSGPYQVGAQLNNVTKFLFGHMIWIDLPLVKVREFKKVLSKKHEISIKIHKNKQLKILNDLENSWSLHGLADALDRARAVCIIKKSPKT